MKQSLAIAVVTAGMLVAIPVFSQDAKPVADKTKQVAPPEPVPVLAVPAGYSYRTDGRRDPFLNPLPKTQNDPEAPSAPPSRPPGLKGLLLAEVAINGVVVSREPGMTRAVIVGPGKKTYFAGRGDTLFDAVVKEIRPTAVVFTAISPSTKQPTNKEIVRSVSTSAGENK
jgi:hypothetical protein